MIVFGLFITILPLFGGIAAFLSSNDRKGALFSTACAYAGFFVCVVVWILGIPYLQADPSYGLILNPLSWLMMMLALYISAIVHHFSIRYMNGQKIFKSYLLRLSFLTSSVLFLTMADHFLFLGVFWLANNMLLVGLLIHDKKRPESKQAGILALKGFCVGSMTLAASLTILYLATGSASLTSIMNNHHHLRAATRNIAGILLIITAIIQSGAFPFHKWLMSSLNSPTTVSAFMHAGLINGGGLLLVRFAPLFSESELLMGTVYSMGFVSLFLGSIWKLMQHSVKRMLVCSTMGQMGFMLVQCGLGLFPAAVAHLCWHGLFKAFLFLQSGSALEEHYFKNDQGVKVWVFIFACACGTPGAWAFASIAHYHIAPMNGSLVLVFFAFMATTQVALAILMIKFNFARIVFAAACSVVSGAVYGMSVLILEKGLPHLNACPAQPLSFLHLFTLSLTALYWMILNLELKQRFLQTNFWKGAYVKLLNASQPDPSTLAL